MRKALALTTALSILTALGCVVRTHHTIEARIEVDVRYVEERADDILDFIDGETDELELEGKESRATPRVIQFLEYASFMQVAHAQDDSEARLRELAESMRARRAKIDELKRAGCMGEDNRGYVDLRPCDGLTDDEAKNAAQQLKAEENKDRKELYNIVARQRDGISVGETEEVFAEKYRERAESGELFQLPPTGARFDAFKASAKGKALGDACQPNAWVKMP